MTPELQRHLKRYRLTADEYKMACSLLGRPLKEIEWPLFSALWSEHCSYKSSKKHLKTFAKTKTDKVLESEGENAGVVDLGQGERIAFKMESHNHPSFIEPYQGAATGVGGILRDIFTMGARPIALADYLCFGEPSAPRMKEIVNGVVRGISGYGNCVGVPTITGQTHFHSSYNQNVLVNAMAVGYFGKHDKIALSKGGKPGQAIVYVGAKTGKDGIHGAAMASESFGEDSEAKKPNVQIGDPYYEKLLIESCLEVIQKDLVVAIQDMGAAGLTSSSFEMASKGQIGLRMDLDKVPVRDHSITPEEILLSESQERMLLIVKPENIEKIKAVFSHWSLDAEVIGEVLKERHVQLYWHGMLLTEIDPDLLVENAPMYERDYIVSSGKNKKEKFTDVKTDPVVRVQTIDSMSREAIYRQYDQRVGAMTARDAENPVALQRLPESGRGLGIVVGCRPELMRMDPKIGAYDSVAYPALQLATIGCRTEGLTDCLNFGSPENPEVMGQFVDSIHAITEMSMLLKAPVISGNVSFYNETLGKSITPTPAIGAIGLRPDVEKVNSNHFTKELAKVYLVELNQIELAGLFVEHPVWHGDFSTETTVQFINEIQKYALANPEADLCTVGLSGVGNTLFKMGRKNNFGVRLWNSDVLKKRPQLYQVIIATAGSVPAFKTSKVSVHEIGFVQKDALQTPEASWILSHLEELYQSAWKRFF